MQEGYINGEFVVIITDHGDAGIVERSKSWNVPLIVIERSDYDSKVNFEQAQLDALEPYKVDGIVLAGYMRIVGTKLIERYEHKILNIHPALLPSFPGLLGHQQAIDGGVKITGCTVTLLMQEWIRAQSLCRIRCLYYPDDTEDTLSDRLLPIEHKRIEEAKRLFCEDVSTIRSKWYILKIDG